MASQPSMPKMRRFAPKFAGGHTSKFLSRQSGEMKNDLTSAKNRHILCYEDTPGHNSGATIPRLAHEIPS